MGHGRELFKFSIFVATPVAVALVTTHPVLREYVLRLFPHRAWDEELLRRQGQEDVIARNISERQRWKTAVLERAKKPDSPGDGPGTAPPGAREPRD